jgi:hypothetical protein
LKGEQKAKNIEKSKIRARVFFHLTDSFIEQSIKGLTLKFYLNKKSNWNNKTYKFELQSISI